MRKLQHLLNIVRNVTKQFELCNTDFLADWRVIKYIIFVATLMTFATCMTYVDFPPFVPSRGHHVLGRHISMSEQNRFLVGMHHRVQLVCR